MKSQLPSARKLTWYFAIVAAIALAAGFYFSDTNPPELLGFEIDKSTVSASDPSPQLSFSGQITDVRGITSAELHCMAGDQTRLLIYIAMAGGDRNRVSFGEVSGSFGWAGRWSGTAYDLEFEGLGILPPSIEPTECSWHARLGDIIGNEAVFDTGVKLQIVG